MQHLLAQHELPQGSTIALPSINLHMTKLRINRFHLGALEHISKADEVALEKSAAQGFLCQETLWMARA